MEIPGHVSKDFTFPSFVNKIAKQQLMRNSWFPAPACKKSLQLTGYIYLAVGHFALT